jgi:hypothetical protein
MPSSASIAGKQLVVYSTSGNRSYSPKDIGDFLKKFELYHALRLIGVVSCELASTQEAPVNDCVLPYLAMRLIESSNDYRKETMTRADLRKAVDMYWGLPDPIANDENSTSCLLRFSSQFEYQRDLSNFLPRTLAIYRNLWSLVPEAVPIDAAITSVTGLSIEELLVLCFAFSGQTNKTQGFFRTYPEDRLSDERERQFFSKEKQEAFVRWISCDYKTFRQMSKAELLKVHDPSFEKFRLNPLLTYPAVRPDKNPSPGIRQVYLVPSLRLMLERVTKGMYFELSNHFRETGRKNPFRTSFGYVFQTYVGELLRNAIGAERVWPERQYDKQRKLTTDWIVRSADRAILIEVKQSGIHLEAKSFGDLARVRKDLASSIAKAVHQLFNFEEAIHSRQFPELSDLHALKEIEHVVVTHDRTYFSNSILRQQVRVALSEAGIELPDDFHWHVMSIDELENLLGMNGVALEDLLRAKRLCPEEDMMDFGDYLGHKYPGMRSYNAYLSSISDAFFLPRQKGEDDDRE